MTIKPLLIMAGIILLLGGTVAALLSDRAKIKTERDQAIQYSLVKDDSLVQMTTKLGQVTTRSTVLELTIKNLERLEADKDLAWLKEIKGINKRLNNVEQISSMTARVVGSFKIDLEDTLITYHSPRDTASIHARKFDNKNQWIRLRGYITPDTLVATPEIFVPLQSVIYWERQKKFLGIKYGRKKWFKQTTSPNPYVQVTKDELIRVSKRKPK